MATNVRQLPDTKHDREMDAACQKVREAIQYNGEISFAEGIAILEMVKFDIMRDMRKRAGLAP